MNELVIMKNKQAVTTSLQVAESFGKEHRNVMRSIRNLTAQNSAVKNMFYEDTYFNSRGQKQPIFYMNRDGFTLLAMGFTGEQAMDFKLKYIQAFNQMETIIREGIPQTPEEQLQLTMRVANRLVKRMDNVEEDINFLKNTSEITSAQRYKLNKMRNAVAVKVCGGKKSNFYKEKSARKVFKALEHDFKDNFMISRYEDLTKEQFDDALTFIERWYPPYPLAKEIKEINAQPTLI